MLVADSRGAHVSMEPRRADMAKMDPSATDMALCTCGMATKFSILREGPFAHGAPSVPLFPASFPYKTARSKEP